MVRYIVCPCSKHVICIDYVAQHGTAPHSIAQHRTAMSVAAVAAGYASVVEVVQGQVEELSLEAQVDVLVSEPMGTLLVNERMLETYLYARNRFLKKGGRMFPVSKSPCTPPWLFTVAGEV